MAIQFKLLLLVLLFGWQNFAYATTAAEELAQLLTQTHSMQANFEQRALGKKDRGVGTLQASGQVTMVRPGKFKWDTQQPVKQLVMVNNDIIWIYDVDLQQATRQKVNSQQPGNPAMLLSSNPKDLQKFFTITKVANTSGINFKLLPKAANSMYQSLQLQFVDDQLQSMCIEDSLGQKSKITFTKIAINIPLDAKLFVFTPPRGVDVIAN